MVELETWQIVLIAIAAAIVVFSGIVLFFDIARVFMFVRYYHLPRADPKKVAAYRKKMEDAYFNRGDEEDGSSNPFRHITTDEEFEANIAEFERQMVAKGASPNGTFFTSFDDPYLKLLRESIGVVIAPRAVLFQVAHPYVAVGINQHSNIVRDTPKRFHKTYFHMFRMAFGTREQAIKSARLLRKTHNRVFGKLDHSVGGILKEGDSYTAAHTHALLWVGLALAESVTFGYEALVGSFTPKEREQLAQNAAYGMMLFGLPKKIASGTYDDFRVAIEACWESDIIHVSPEARQIAQHLLFPTKWYLKPVFAVARYITRVIMPEKLQVEFFGKKANIFDQVFVSVVGGIGRFFYRLVPGPLRYVPEYSQAVRRYGKSTACCCLFDPCARLMEGQMRYGKDFFMELVLPRVNDKVNERKTDHVEDASGQISPTPFASRKTNEVVSAYQIKERDVEV